MRVRVRFYISIYKLAEHDREVDIVSSTIVVGVDDNEHL